MLQRNNARSTNYLFIIGENRDNIYNVQSSNVNDFLLGITPISIKEKDLYFPSNKLETEVLTVSILCSEDYREWLYFYKWMLKLKNNNSAHIDWVKTCELIALDSQNQPSTRFVYHDCFPFTIDSLQYSVVGDEGTSLFFTVSLRYNLFKVVDVNGNEFADDWNGDFE